MIEIDTSEGMVRDARQVESPNHDARPLGSDPELIVIHGISLPPGEFGGPWIEQLFTNSLDPAIHPSFAEIAELRVSSHLLIRRDGELVQFVPLKRRAWHAGRSAFRGRTDCNDFSIGIEVEGADNVAYTSPQYGMLSELVAALWRSLPTLMGGPIVGHSDIAPDRKTDPGAAFDWQRFRDLLARAESRADVLSGGSAPL